MIDLHDNTYKDFFEALGSAYAGFCDGICELRDAISSMLSEVLPPAAETVNELVRISAIAYGAPAKVVRLSRRKGKTGKKNMRRLCRFLEKKGGCKLYEHL